MKKLLFSVVCFSLVLSGISIFLTGCEDAEGLEPIVVTPSAKEMESGENSFWLTASFPGVTDTTKEDGTTTNDTTTVTYGDPVDPEDSLHLPLEWKVTNPTLGQIIGSAGTSALYTRNAAMGVNTIIVRDQYGNEGYATVYQRVEMVMP